MIYKLPKKDDPFKDYMEKITKELANKNISEINENIQKEHLAKIKENLPQLENEINTLINSLKVDISTYDAKQILDYFGASYSLSSTDTVVDDMDNDKNFKLDYLHSLTTSIGLLDGKECNKETLTRIKETIEKIKMQSIIYLMFSSEHKGLANDIQFLQITHNMVVRGDSYLEHKIKMCRELFLKFNEVLKTKYDITSDKLIDELINIAKYPIKNLKIQQKYINEMTVEHKYFSQEADKIDSGENLDNFFEKYSQSCIVSQGYTLFHPI